MEFERGELQSKTNQELLGLKVTLGRELYFSDTKKLSPELKGVLRMLRYRGILRGLESQRVLTPEQIDANRKAFFAEEK